MIISDGSWKELRFGSSREETGHSSDPMVGFALGNLRALRRLASLAHARGHGSPETTRRSRSRFVGWRPEKTRDSRSPGLRRNECPFHESSGNLEQHPIVPNPSHGSRVLDETNGLSAGPQGSGRGGRASGVSPQERFPAHRSPNGKGRRKRYGKERSFRRTFSQDPGVSTFCRTTGRNLSQSGQCTESLRLDARSFEPGRACFSSG